MKAIIIIVLISFLSFTSDLFSAATIEDPVNEFTNFFEPSSFANKPNETDKQSYFIVLRSDISRKKVAEILQDQLRNLNRPHASSTGTYARCKSIFNLPLLRGFTLEVSPPIKATEFSQFNQPVFLYDDTDKIDIGLTRVPHERNHSIILKDNMKLPQSLSMLEKYRPYIHFIEKNAQVTLSAGFYAQMGAPPNLDRISEMYREWNRNFYVYNEYSGFGTDCYIVDSGILTTHEEFGGRAQMLADFTGEGFADALGHGTHVAGIAGGRTFGVAKLTNLLGVKVIGASASSDWNTVVAALNWIYSRVQLTRRPSVINISLGGPTSYALTLAIRSLVSAGILVVGASGNDAYNACFLSPGASPDAIVVAGTNADDTFLTVSNSGQCVDILAPGSFIQSSYNTGNTASAFMTGTSMACPHVVGALALLWSAHPTWTAAQVKNTLLQGAMMGRIYNLPTGTPNRFLYSSLP